LYEAFVWAHGAHDRLKRRCPARAVTGNVPGLAITLTGTVGQGTIAGAIGDDGQVSANTTPRDL
jgi:hypothetical protein